MGEYDANSNVTRKAYDYDGDGTAEHIYTYEYNADGTRTRKTWDYDADGVADWAESFEFALTTFMGHEIGGFFYDN